MVSLFDLCFKMIDLVSSGPLRSLGSIFVQAQDFRIYSQEVLEFGEKVSFLLLLPPSDEVCTAPGQNYPYSPRSGFLTLPLQIFELGQYRTFVGTNIQIKSLMPVALCDSFLI